MKPDPGANAAQPHSFQEGGQLAGAPDRVVPVAVVHDHVGFPGLPGQGLYLRFPRTELLLGVVVPEPVGGLPRSRLPRFGVSAVEPNHGQVPGGSHSHRRKARVEPLGHVHTYVRDVMVAQKRERLLLVGTLHPRLVAELHGDPEVFKAFLALQDVRLRLAPDHEPLRKLEEHRTQFAGRVQGHERIAETPPHLDHQLVRHLLPVQVALLEQLVGEGLLHVLVQRIQLGGVVRQQRVRLDVEGEMLRCSLRPEDSVPLAGREVIGGVHLHDGELSGIELEPLLGRGGALRVEVALLDQGRLRPRRDADEHLSLRTHGDGGQIQPAALMASEFRSLRRASRSISRTRSPDNPITLPTSRRLMACPFSNPYRSAMTRRSRGSSTSITAWPISWRSMASSTWSSGLCSSACSSRSPSSVSSPTGAWSETGSLRSASMSRSTSSGGIPSSLASSGGVGSRPCFWLN